jgi:hypothetical protein
LKDFTNTHLQEGDLWAGGQLLVWKPEHAGDRMDLPFSIASPGMKRIYITAALTPGSGKFSVLLDGQRLRTADGEDVINLFRPHRILLRNFPLKSVELAEGKHILTLESREAADRGDSSEIGIDFIWVQALGK